MISGALLLNRDEPIRKILKDRFLKYAVVLLVSLLRLRTVAKRRKNTVAIMLCCPWATRR